MFGAMSIYGLTTRKDLTSWGSFFFMGLVGIILASIVNIFLKSPTINFVVSAIGVIVFVGLTAYDTQKLKVMGETAPLDDSLAIRRGTILGALTLYLDFINLFLMLLRFLGQTRD
jgi:FtsH-binding integral membrane protein